MDKNDSYTPPEDIERGYAVVNNKTGEATSYNTFSDLQKDFQSVVNAPEKAPKPGLGESMLTVAGHGATGAGIGAGIGSVVPVVGNLLGAAIGGVIGIISGVGHLFDRKDELEENWEEQTKAATKDALTLVTDEETGEQRINLNRRLLGAGNANSGKYVKDYQRSAGSARKPAYWGTDGHLKVDVAPIYADSDEYQEILALIEDRMAGLTPENDTNGEYLKQINEVISSSQQNYLYDSISAPALEALFPGASTESIDQALQTQKIGAIPLKDMDDKELADYKVYVYKDGAIEESNAKDMLDIVKNMEGNHDQKDTYIETLAAVLADEAMPDSTKAIVKGQVDALFGASRQEGTKYSGMLEKSNWDYVGDIKFIFSMNEIVESLSLGNWHPSISYLDDNEFWATATGFMSLVGTIGASQKIMSAISDLSAAGLSKAATGISNIANKMNLQDVSAFFSAAANYMNTLNQSGITWNAAQFATKLGLNVTADLVFDLGKLGFNALGGREMNFWNEFSEDVLIDFLFSVMSVAELKFYLARNGVNSFNRADMSNYIQASKIEPTPNPDGTPGVALVGPDGRIWARGTTTGGIQGETVDAADNSAVMRTSNQSALAIVNEKATAKFSSGLAKVLSTKPGMAIADAVFNDNASLMLAGYTAAGLTGNPSKVYVTSNYAASDATIYSRALGNYTDGKYNIDPKPNWEKFQEARNQLLQYSGKTKLTQTQANYINAKQRLSRLDQDYDVSSQINQRGHALLDKYLEVPAPEKALLDRYYDARAAVSADPGKAEQFVGLTSSEFSEGLKIYQNYQPLYQKQKQRTKGGKINRFRRTHRQMDDKEVILPIDEYLNPDESVALYTTNILTNISRNEQINYFLGLLKDDLGAHVDVVESTPDSAVKQAVENMSPETLVRKYDVPTEVQAKLERRAETEAQYKAKIERQENKSYIPQELNKFNEGYTKIQNGEGWRTETVTTINGKQVRASFSEDQLATEADVKELIDKAHSEIDTPEKIANLQANAPAELQYYLQLAQGHPTAIAMGLNKSFVPLNVNGESRIYAVDINDDSLTLSLENGEYDYLRQKALGLLVENFTTSFSSTLEGLFTNVNKEIKRIGAPSVDPLSLSETLIVKYSPLIADNRTELIMGDIRNQIMSILPQQTYEGLLKKWVENHSQKYMEEQFKAAETKGQAYSLKRNEAVPNAALQNPLIYWSNGEKKVAYLIPKTKTGTAIAEGLTDILNAPMYIEQKNALVRGFNYLTRKFAQTIRDNITGRNPTRVISNVERDFVTAAIRSGGASVSRATETLLWLADNGKFTEAERQQIIDDLNSIAREAKTNTQQAQLEAMAQGASYRERVGSTKPQSPDVAGLPRREKTKKQMEYQFKKLIWDATHIGRGGGEDFLTTPGNAAESHTRRKAAQNTYAAQLIVGLENGKTYEEAQRDAREKASWSTRNSTTDYGLKGWLTRWLSKWAPFSFSSFSSRASLVQAIAVDPIGVATHLASFNLAYIISIAMVLSNEESRKRYFNLSDYERSHNFLLPVDSETVMLFNVDEDLVAQMAPIRTVLEGLIAKQPITFWKLFGDVLDNSSVDLSGFTEGDRFNFWRGVEKAASQYVPSLLTFVGEQMTGRDWYYGSDISVDDDYLRSRGITDTSAGAYTTTNKNSLTLYNIANTFGIPQWRVQHALETFGGQIGQYVLYTLDKVQGATEKETGGTDPLRALVKPLSIGSQSGISSAFYEGLNTFKEKKVKVEAALKAKTAEINVATGSEYTKKMQEWQKIIDDFSIEVADWLNQYVDRFEMTSGLTQAQAQQIYYLFDFVDQNGSEVFPSGTAGDYYQGKLKQQGNYTAGNAVSGFLDRYYNPRGSLYKDSNGDFVRNKSYAERNMINQLNNETAVHHAALNKIISDNNIKDRYNEVYNAREAIYNKGTLTSEDYSQLDLLAAQWDRELGDLVLPYFVQNGTDILRGDVLNLLGNYFIVIGDYEVDKRGRRISAPNLNKQRGFAKQFITDYMKARGAK